MLLSLFLLNKKNYKLQQSQTLPADLMRAECPDGQPNSSRFR